MKIKVLLGKNGIRSGTILDGREIRNAFGLLTGYQCTSGQHIGRVFQPIDVAVLEKEFNKVKLPRQVAEGLDYARARWRGIAIMDAIKHKKDGYGLEFVYAWVYKNPGSLQEGDRKDMIMTALVNGYEVEDSPEEKLEIDLADIVYKWMYEDNELPDDENLRLVAKRIIERMKGENENAGH